MLKKILVSLAAASVLAAVGACDVTPSGQDIENRQQAAAQKSLDEAQTLPVFSYSQIKQNMIELETAEANGIQTTSFIFGGANDPDPIEICPSVGVPIPSTASLSNPQQVAHGWNDGPVIAQEDPNGVYMPTAGSGTFVMCVQPDGSVTPVYAEGNVHTVFGPATWDKGTHTVVLTGASSTHFSSAKGK
jgi:hypothetical protein